MPRGKTYSGDATSKVSGKSKDRGRSKKNIVDKTKCSSKPRSGHASDHDSSHK